MYGEIIKRKTKNRQNNLPVREDCILIDYHFGSYCLQIDLKLDVF